MGQASPLWTWAGVSSWAVGGTPVKHAFVQAVAWRLSSLGVLTGPDHRRRVTPQGGGESPRLASVYEPLCVPYDPSAEVSV